MKQLPVFVLLVLCLAACGKESTESAPAAAPAAAAGPQPVDPKLLVISGPGGEVAIGDPLEKAKKAFPIPKGAIEHNATTALMAVSPEGWGWSNGADITEVAAKDGRVVAISGPTENPKDFDAAAKAVVAKLGKPTNEAKGTNALMYVWESGDNVHFYMQIKMDLGLFGKGAGHVVGPKAELKAMGFDHNNPQLFVKMLDQIAEQMLKAKK